MKRFASIVISCVLAANNLQAQVAQNRPYVDDKLFHFGFQLGVNVSSFLITDSETPITNPLTGETVDLNRRDIEVPALGTLIVKLVK